MDRKNDAIVFSMSDIQVIAENQWCGQLSSAILSVKYSDCPFQYIFAIHEKYSQTLP